MEITPGRSRKRGGGAAKRVKATLAEYTKMIAHKGIFVLSKRGLCFRTMAYLFCQCVSPYFKFIAYKLALGTVRDRNASHSAPHKGIKTNSKPCATHSVNPRKYVRRRNARISLPHFNQRWQKKRKKKREKKSLTVT